MKHAEGESGAPALLHADELTLKGVGSLSGSFSTSGDSVCLVGAAGQVAEALASKQLVLSGELRLRGGLAARDLESGAAGYAPQRIPLAAKTSVFDALKISAQLIGLSKSDVEDALSICRLSGQAKKPLSSLSTLQERLVGLAHGIVGSPEVLILEDLYEGLEDSEADVIETILEEQLLDSRWIAIADLETPHSRRLVAQADEVILSAGSHLSPPVSPLELRTDSFWVTCNGNADPLLELLSQRTIRATKSSSDSVLLARGTSGKVIFAAAAEAGVTILDLTPMIASQSEREEGGVHAPSHARSGA